MINFYSFLFLEYYHSLLNKVPEIDTSKRHQKKFDTFHQLVDINKLGICIQDMKHPGFLPFET